MSSGKIKKRRTISATSKTLSETAFSNVGAFATEKIKELGNGMLGGNIAAEPYLLDSKSGCDYCAYHGVSVDLMQRFRISLS